ncbi:MAG: SMP-30/gluconolactonase/LRE family protein [Rhizomicrobium sp.]
MKPWKRIAFTTSTVAVAGVAIVVARALIMGGMFASVTPGFAGTCRTVGGVVGAEDMQIDRKDGLVFISASDRRAILAGKPDDKDGLYVIALRESWIVAKAGGSVVTSDSKDGKSSSSPRETPAGVIARLSDASVDFHPHGISLFRGADGSLTLMAINHRTDGKSTIEIFNVKLRLKGVLGPNIISLSEIGDIESDRLISPNDLVAVGKEQFYVTNDHGSRTPFGRMLETYLMLPRANVLYFDGNVFKEVANNLVFANGINISPDGNRLYVAETTPHQIQTFNRDLFSGKLTPDATFTLPSGPDNIDVDDKGDLWVAAHPKLFGVLAYRDDPSKPSPSEVFRIPVKSGELRDAQQIYANLGEQIGAASVGAVAGGHLFIGSIFDPKILDCTLP